MAAERPLLRDVIDIKPQISTSDFVLRLAEATTQEGVGRALQDYVVTERLLENFDDALGLIRTALNGNTSKAAYLHGSFGSGKSHFMAVLCALLANNPAARARPELDPLLSRHEWLQTAGQNFLMVPYHMLGAKSMEQRVLGGYVRHVQQLHPEAPIPAVYRTEGMFTTLRSMRERLGDAAVIQGLGGADEEADEWGETFGWTSELLDTALAAAEEHESDAQLNLVHPSTPTELRLRLAQDARSTLLSGFADDAAENEHGFVSLDKGLSVVTEHARSLGYDGLVLFLDELILWLATHIHDQKFVAREADKINSFVEGSYARRAIPVVSFIARQRDLRELVGEEASGAVEAAIQDTLNLVSGRFEEIILEDRNLPQVANARLLQPVSAEAQTQLDAAFEQTKKAGPQVWDTLLGAESGTTGADETSFRLTYPFSPVFLDTLVHLSAALQRSRTGLKVMGELLARNREHLRLGQLVPLGELYPVLASGGDRPFGDHMRVVFEAADKLYQNKLRPYLLSTFDLTEEQLAQYHRDPGSIEDSTLLQRLQSFTGDHRLVCTLLLSALAPGVPALNELTIRRLGALNHGSVISPIPGAEVGVIKNKVAEWAARFPEIKETGTEANPGVRLELAGIDVDSVIQNAAVNDNTGNRGTLARRLLAEELSVQRNEGRLDADELHLVWRGSSRVLEVVFGNLADREELPDHDLQPQLEQRWRLVVDLPYDEQDYGPRDDINRFQELRERQREPSRTAAWVPTHLSAQRFRDFRTLVIIDKALANEQRFATQYAAHLNSDDRSRAWGLLQTQREALLKQVRSAIRQAYGLAEKQSADVTLDFTDHLQALPDVGGLALPVGKPMQDAVRDIAATLLAHQYPAHPELAPDAGAAIRQADAKTVFAHVREAADARDHRVEIPAKDRRIMAQLAGPLGLGQQKEAYFELSTHWAEHFRTQARTDGETGDLSLTALTTWLDRPEPRGLEPFLANLTVAAFAEMDDRVWVRGGTPLDPPPELHQIRSGDALRSQPLPGEEDWNEARRRFEAIFGKRAPELCRGRLVNQFARQINDEAREHLEPSQRLVRMLEQHADVLGLDDIDENPTGGRLALARRSVELLNALAGGDGSESGLGAVGTNTAKKTVEALARFDLNSVTPERYGTSIKRAPDVAHALANASWPTLELAEGQGTQGHVLLQELRQTARADQRTSDLVAELRRITGEVLAVVKRQQASAPAPDPAPAEPSAGSVDLGTSSSSPTVATPATSATPEQHRTTPAPGQDSGRRRSGTRRTTAARAVGEVQSELAELAAANPEATIEITWRVVEE